MELSATMELRTRAWADVKSAVRAYARNPSDGNARKVESCWKVIRQCEAAAGHATRNRANRMAARNPVAARSKARARRPVCAEDAWPVNEIILRSLLGKGLNDAAIAALYHVPRGAVSDRRRVLDL